ncbi:hypothetical protein [Caenispirillum salinarum]|uniref:hypothetical protein n=1 Tax=Caenispirillum salinarum TaxID=859058 RepID=UPI00384DF193
MGTVRTLLAATAVLLAPAPETSSAAAQDQAAGAALAGEPGIAQVAPRVMIEHILTALMFEPDWRLALALFHAFQQNAAATQEPPDAEALAHELASEMLLFLPVDQGRQLAPGLLLALAPDADGRRLEAAVDLGGLIGEDPETLADRAHARVQGQAQAAMLPLAAEPRASTPMAAPVDPSPAVPPAVLRVIGSLNPDDLSGAIDASRQWGVILYRLLTLVPDAGEATDYSRWYAVWRALAAESSDNAGAPPLPLQGGDTASPR